MACQKPSTNACSARNRTKPRSVAGRGMPRRRIDAASCTVPYKSRGCRRAGAFASGSAMEQALQSLAPRERAARYRQFAAEALLRATEAENDFAKAGHLDMAARWDSLAQDMERRLD